MHAREDRGMPNDDCISGPSYINVGGPCSYILAVAFRLRRNSINLTARHGLRTVASKAKAVTSQLYYIIY